MGYLNTCSNWTEQIYWKTNSPYLPKHFCVQSNFDWQQDACGSKIMWALNFDHACRFAILSFINQ